MVLDHADCRYLWLFASPNYVKKASKFVASIERPKARSVSASGGFSPFPTSWPGRLLFAYCSIDTVSLCYAIVYYLWHLYIAPIPGGSSLRPVKNRGGWLRCIKPSHGRNWVRPYDFCVPFIKVMYCVKYHQNMTAPMGSTRDMEFALMLSFLVFFGHFHWDWKRLLLVFYQDGPPDNG